MVLHLKLQKLGDSVGIVLPQEALERLDAAEGDEIVLSEAPEGGFRLTPNRPESARTMAVAEDLSRRYKNALAELAK